MRHRAPLLAAYIGIGLVSTLALACCTGQGAKSTTVTTAAASTPTSGSPSGPPTTIPDVKAELLTLSDLPAGWSVNNSNSDSSSSAPKCVQNARNTTGYDKAKAEADFQDGSNGLPALDEEIVYQPGHAQQTMAQFAQVMAGCGKIQFSISGHTLTGTVGQMSFPSLGQQTEPYQINLSTTVSGLDITVGLDLIAIRQGDEIAVIYYGDLGTPDINQVQEFAQKAISKI